LARPWDRLKGGQEETTEPALQQTAESTLADESASIYTPTLAEIYVKQGLTDKAVGVYEEILRQDPDNSSARTRLQELRASTEPAEATPAACIDDEFGAEAVDFTEEDMAEQGELPVSQAAPRVRGPLATLERWLAGIQQRRVHVR
jgi:predicted TPR repeat methyltransferase